MSLGLFGNRAVYILCVISVVLSMPIHADPDCIAVASKLSFEQDEQYDGFLLGRAGCLYDPKKYTIDDIPAVQPTNNTRHQSIGVFVNGKGNTAQMQFKNLHILANATGMPMVGIHNAARLGWGELTEMGPNSIPAKILRDNIIGRLNAGKRIRIWSSSQGTFYVSRALNQTEELLKDKTILIARKVIQWQSCTLLVLHSIHHRNWLPIPETYRIQQASSHRF